MDANASGCSQQINGRMLCLRNNTSWKSEVKRTGCLEYITACHGSMSHESNGELGQRHTTTTCLYNIDDEEDYFQYQAVYDIYIDMIDI